MKVISLMFKPPIMVAFLTMGPFGIYFSDYLSEKSLYLSRQVGFDPIALGYAISCVMAFIAGYFALYRQKQPKVNRYNFRITEKFNYRKRKFFYKATMVTLFLSIIGVGVTLYTVNVGGEGYVATVLERLILGQSAADLIYNSTGYMKSESVPGMIRMFGSLSNSAVILWLALAATCWNFKVGKAYWVILTMLLFLNTFRSVIGGDRYPALIAFILVIYVFWIQNPTIHKKNTQIILSAISSILILTLSILAYKGLDSLRGAENYNTLLLYSDLGVANLSLAMSTGHGHTYGLNTVLSTLEPFLRALHINVELPVFVTEYIWSPPANLLMASYADYNIFGFILYFIMGLVAAIVETKYLIKPHNPIWSVAFLHLIYALSSIFTVPGFFGQIFIIGLLASLVAASILNKYEKSLDCVTLFPKDTCVRQL